jgi:four helix bundle protein
MPGNSETHEQNFEQLDCWKACRELRIFIFRVVVPLLPVEEKFRLIDQLIRAARSSTANIAEGDGRFNYLDNSKFCRNARGSCKEVLDHMITANDEDLISSEILLQGRMRVESAVKLLSAYIRYLINAKRSDS